MTWQSLPLNLRKNIKFNAVAFKSVLTFNPDFLERNWSSKIYGKLRLLSLQVEPSGSRWVIIYVAISHIICASSSQYNFANVSCNLVFMRYTNWHERLPSPITFILLYDSLEILNFLCVTIFSYFLKPEFCSSPFFVSITKDIKILCQCLLQLCLSLYIQEKTTSRVRHCDLFQ